MGPIGIPEMMAICMIALLLFGPKKLPELGRTLGKALSEFRRAKNELKATFDTHMQELEREVRLDSQKKSLPEYTAPSADYSSVNYPYPYDDNAPYEPPVGASSPTENVPEPALPADPPQEEHAPHALPAPVEGAVPRSNGVHPVTQPTVAAEEERPA